MTSSTAGRPLSAPCSVERRDPARQLSQRVNPHGRHPLRLRVTLLDDPPRPPPDQRRPQPETRRRPNVVIQPVTHIQDLARRIRRDFKYPPEESRLRLGHTPVIRRGNHVRWQIQPPQDVTRPGRLIPGDTHPQAIGPELAQRGPHVRVQVILAEPLGLASVGPLLPRLLQIKPRLEHLERLPIVEAVRNDRAEHCRERMTRNTQPVSPRTVLPGLVHQALANVKDDRTNHGSHPTAAPAAQSRHAYWSPPRVR